MLIFREEQYKEINSGALPREAAKFWINFEINVRRIAANKELREICPFNRPDIVAIQKSTMGFGITRRPKLGIFTYEYFFLTKDDHDADMEYLRKIYAKYNYSDLRLDHIWLWGRHLYATHFDKKNPELGYNKACKASRKIEMKTRFMLLNYEEDVQKFAEE